MAEHHWWNCGRVVYVVDTNAWCVYRRRARRPGRSVCKFGIDTLRLGMWGEIFDAKTGPGPNVFPTMAEAAEYMEAYCLRLSEGLGTGWSSWFKLRAAEWKATAARARAKEAKVKA